MEEKTKEVKMNNQKEEKISYEKLNEIAGQLYNENKQLKQQAQQYLDALKSINRLDYLFRVVECAGNNKGDMPSFDPNFVEECIVEIQQIITPNVEEQGAEKKN